MDIKQYISSGILEQYVLGNVSDQEGKAVQCLSKIYPEIKEELISIERSVELFAIANAINPPDTLKAKIVSSIKNIEQIKPTDSEASGGGSSAQAPATGSRMGMRLFIGLLGLLLLASIMLWRKASNEKSQVQSQMVALQEDYQETQTELQSVTTNLLAVEESNNALADAATVQVNMAGTDNSPESNVRVFWNKNSSEVFLKVDNLPATAADKQYQLWAIVDGVPQDMGVFDLDLATTSLQKAPFTVQNAQAFAITLEDRGGSVEPTLTAMYVLGEV